MVTQVEILKPSKEAIDYVLSLDHSLLLPAWMATHQQDGRAWYSSSLQGIYQCKTDFDKGRSHAQRIWKAFMAEYVTRRMNK